MEFLAGVCTKKKQPTTIINQEWKKIVEAYTLECIVEHKENTIQKFIL